MALKRLYIEMIGSESNFFTKQVADSFSYFLLNSGVNEMYIPFCCLVDCKPSILDDFARCNALVSIKDDTLDYDFILDDEHNAAWAKYLIDEKKKEQLLKAREYHQIAQKQCAKNITQQLIPFVCVDDVANTIADFVGYDANPENWLIDE